MAEKIRTVLPDKAQSGASIYPASVAGRKAKIVDQTSEAVASGLSLDPGDIVGIRFNLALYPPQLPIVSREFEDTIQANEIVSWPQINIFVDNDLQNDYAIHAGPLLDSDQAKVRMTIFQAITPQTISGSINYSATALASLWNDGSSAHTVYIYVSYKYIIYGEVST